MFEFFPKINYNFNGTIHTVTNIFKSINLDLDSAVDISEMYITPGERPDNISNKLYNKSNLYWSLFLVNNIKNPLKNWSLSQNSHDTETEIKYSGWEYQFANISPFNSGNTFNFDNNKINSYNGVNFDDILEGDLIIYETGIGSYSIQCIGSGGLTSDNSFCSSPQYGQSNIPENFDDQSSVINTTCGAHFTACLTSNGYIRVWGKFSPISSFTKEVNLWKSNIGGYTFIYGNGDTLLAIKDQSGIVECYGDCTAFTNFGVSAFTDYSKIAWASNGICGGVAITTSGSTRHFGFTGFQSDMGATFSNIACGSNFCSGIKGSNKEVVVWKGNLGITLCTSGIVAGGITVSGFTCDYIAAGDNHIVVKKHIGGLTAWGDNTYNQCNVINFPANVSLISAGSKHSAAISTNNIHLSGKITTYNYIAGCTGAQENIDVSNKSISGNFSNISSGKEHMCLQKSGLNKKYIGVISSIDSIYKRIFVKSHQFTDPNSIIINDPSGIVVSIWRWDNSRSSYLQVKTIQNQLLSIQKYLDSTLYITQNDNMVDVTSDSNWFNLYLPNYQTAASNSNFITLRKKLMNDVFLKKQQISYLSNDKIDLLKRKINDNITVSDIINIKISEL